MYMKTMEEYMKKYFLIAIAIVSVLLVLSACAKGKTEPTSISQQTRDKVFETVKLNLPDLQAIYHEHNAATPMTGAVNISLFINTKGDVTSAKVEPLDGNLSKVMLKAVKEEVMTWAFTTEEMMNYQFKVNFNKM